MIPPESQNASSISIAPLCSYIFTGEKMATRARKKERDVSAILQRIPALRYSGFLKGWALGRLANGHPNRDLFSLVQGVFITKEMVSSR